MGNQNEFKVKFNGKLHQVNANTLIDSLVNLSAIIEEINQDQNTGKKIEIKIKALEKGSFCIHLALTAGQSLVKNLFTKDNLSIGAEIITVVTGLIAIKQVIGSKKPEIIKDEGDKIQIKDTKGNIVFLNAKTFNLYKNNQTIQDSLSNTFETLERDVSITGFEITDTKEKPFITVQREDFSKMAIKTEVLQENKKTLTEVSTLNIYKIVFDEKSKWEFYYKGNRIYASIKDDQFQKMIDQGESFAKGDNLVVDLKINQVFDLSVNTFINHSYEILRVIKHIPRGEQQKLNLDIESNTKLI